MPELKVTVPEEVAGEQEELKRKFRELVEFEVKRKRLLSFTDKIMEGAEQLSEEELVKLGRELKKGRYEELETKVSKLGT